MFVLFVPLPWVSCPLLLCPLTLWACYSTIYLVFLGPYQLITIYDFSGKPARDLPSAPSRLCLGSSWAPCRWLLLLSLVGVAFIECRLSLLILFIIFYCNLHRQKWLGIYRTQSTRYICVNKLHIIYIVVLKSRSFFVQIIYLKHVQKHRKIIPFHSTILFVLKEWLILMMISCQNILFMVFVIRLKH
jgi:hypothetical protein